MLVYPCCGSEDGLKILKRYLDYDNKFVFADLYNLNGYGSFAKSVADNNEISVKTITTGPNNNVIVDSKGIKHIDPTYKHINFKYKNIEKEIILRKGCGQFAIIEAPNNSINYFCHRGDSAGEGGSNICFLCTKETRYKPLSNMFSQLISKLKDQAYIISDGSNIRLYHNKRRMTMSDKGLIKMSDFYRKIRRLSENEVKALLPISVETEEAILTANDIIDRRYNHTLVWQVKKKLTTDIKLESTQS